MNPALIGLIGLLTGMLLTEYYRRLSRIEKYSSNVFDKRLEIHDRLLGLLHRSATLVRNLAEEPDIDVEEAQAQVLAVTLKLMGYCDRHRLFLNEEILVHCGAIFTGAQDIFELAGEARQSSLEEFNRGFRQAVRMIISESGVEELNKLFRSITKAKHRSDIIRYFQHKQREQLRNDR